MGANFRIGQKVVCVDASCTSSLGWFPGSEPKRGRVYTVRSIGIARNHEPGIRLSELTLTTGRPGALQQDAYYRARRFRPAVERKTDISIFRKMLQPSDAEVVG